MIVRMNIGEKGDKHKSCEHSRHGGRDQSQVKNKKFEKIKSVPKNIPKSHNDDNLGITHS